MLFEKQLLMAVPLNEERLSQLTRKKYESGKDINVGDVVLFAYKQSKPYFDGEGDANIDMKIILLSPDEINNYEFNLSTINNVIPTIL